MPQHATALNTAVPAQFCNGTLREKDGHVRVFYDGYWVKYYDVPNTLAYKKSLIDSLKRRVFHHAEPGINTPGDRVADVRRAHDAETDPAKRRVLAAMLAGALLNHGADLLNRIVELEQLGVRLNAENELLRECGRCFMHALEFGHYARPVTGREGLDELWGEPFKVLTMTVPQFLETRYMKLAMTMHAIDNIRDRLVELFERVPVISPLLDAIRELAESAKLSSETIRSDLDTIEIWPRFVAAADNLRELDPDLPKGLDRKQYTLARRGVALLRAGGELMIDLANIRVPMPKSTRAFFARCDTFEKRFLRRLDEP